MHRVEALIAGVRGAENGFVDMVVRGTSTPATYYTDFEGTSSATATNVALDQYGGKVMFVNQLVTVTVKNSGGSTVRQFTAGDAATAVELRSASFNGAAYSGGAVAPGNPTTVAAALDKWVTSAGAVDFKVAINSVATNLSSAFAAVAGLRYYVVTDPTYGAVGDGVTNDLSGIQAAINAANAAGGGVVFFPPGTYLINGTLTTYNKVSLVGYSRTLSTIKTQSGSATLMTGAAPISIKSLTFGFSAANYTGVLLDFTSATVHSVDMFDVQLGSYLSAILQGTFLRYNAASVLTVTVVDSFLDVGQNGKLTSGSGLNQYWRGCRLTAYDTGVASASSLISSGGYVSVSSTSISVQGSSGTRTIISSYQIESTGLTVEKYGAVAIIVFYSADVNAELRENGTSTVDRTLTGSFLMYSGFASSAVATAQYNLVSLGSRRSRVEYVSGNADPMTVTADQARHVVVRVTSTAGWTGNGDVNINVAIPGDDVIVSFWNDTGGAVTFVWAANVSVAGATTFAVAANSFRTFQLVCSGDVPTSYTREWFLVSSTAGAEVVE